MSDAIIQVENLGKRYVIGHKQGGREGLRHAMERALRNPLRWLKERAGQQRALREEFWALKEVSFQVGQGEVVGIIGRNGAGKSTMLKVLSRITEPSTGKIRLKGRVASLLEVGTGFHQELTGRENIFLNGAILGMSRQEIQRKFDEIVAFSEVEKFLDTPVKRYSSGMYVRLAFAVAAHLEPEILVVDEVLAVGDAAFQQKCLGKMDQVSKSEGRTVLFVSHNMGIINRLCKSAVLLEAGRLRQTGGSAEVIGHYLNTGAHAEGCRTWEAGDSPRRHPALQPRLLRIVQAEGRTSGSVDVTKPFQVEFQYVVSARISRFRVAFRFITADGTVAFTSSDSADPGFDSKPCEPGSYSCRCVVPGNLLNHGRYWVSLSADVPFQEELMVEEQAVGFMVEQTGGVNSRYPEQWPGTVCPMLKWSTEIMPSAPGATVAALQP